MLLDVIAPPRAIDPFVKHCGHGLTFQCETQPPVDWDVSLINGRTEGFPLFQTSKWAQLQSDLLACRALFLTVRRGADATVRLIVFHARSKRTNDPIASLKLWVRRLQKRKAGTLFWWGQPVMYPAATSLELQSMASGIA